MAPSKRRTVVLGILGSTLDTGKTADRWTKWRPTVALCQHPDLLVHRLELIHDPRFQSLFDTVAADIAQVSPDTEVRPVPMAIADPWDFEEVYAALHDLSRKYTFTPDEEDYLVHITTGTHVAQIRPFCHGVAAFPGALAPDFAVAGARAEEAGGGLCDHRFRSRSTP